MKLFQIMVVLSAVAGAALASGCQHQAITGINAAPGLFPGDNRQAMVAWHQQHDMKPAAPPAAQ